MKHDRRIIPYIIYILLGVTLTALGLLELVDSFWSGMGGALIAVGAIRMIHFFRYCSDASYRENMEIETKDERNQFIRNKAWAWAGYLFVLITAVCTIAFKLLGQDLLSVAAGFAVSFLVLKKKY